MQDVMLERRATLLVRACECTTHSLQASHKLASLHKSTDTVSPKIPFDLSASANNLDGRLLAHMRNRYPNIQMASI